LPEVRSLFPEKKGLGYERRDEMKNGEDIRRCEQCGGDLGDTKEWRSSKEDI
jgi:hypothetical protein